MSGHSKWAKIKRQKGANDAKRGQVFTKLGNTIAIAAKNGANPDMNPSLALAIEKARMANMPGANIEKAIKRGSGDLSAGQMLELLFEGYGPGNIGIIIESISDNRNRTTSEIKSVFNKNGGNIAAAGSVAYLFERKGVIRLEPAADQDAQFMSAIDAGAEDVIEADGEIIVYTVLKDLHHVRQQLIEQGLRILDAEAQYVPRNLVRIEDKEMARKILKLMEALEDVEDVSATYTNFDIDDEMIAELDQQS